MNIKLYLVSVLYPCQEFLPQLTALQMYPVHILYQQEYLPLVEDLQFYPVSVMFRCQEFLTCLTALLLYTGSVMYYQEVLSRLKYILIVSWICFVLLGIYFSTDSSS